METETHEKSLVICVDDETIVLNSLLLQLRRNFSDRFEIEICSSPEEALELLQDALEDGYKIPLVISDYVMPSMTGDKFLEEVDKITKDTYKVMLTGQATIQGVANAINKANLFRYLSKPWDEADLTLTVDKAVKSYYNEQRIRELNTKNEFLYNKMHDYFLSSIQALSSAIDAKDKCTVGHSKRVTYYSLMLGKAAGLSEEELENLEFMGILHDIGKIGIQDDILHKESSLTDDEYKTMKSHVEIGYEIVRNIKDFDDIFTGILYHHERYDGKGYSGKYSGEDIPIGGRIVCIADSFDAMTSDRPYRQGMSKEAAIEELRKNMGTQFDPKLTLLFIKLMADFDVEAFKAEHQ